MALQAIGEPLNRVPHAPNSPQFCGLFGAPLLICFGQREISPSAEGEQGLCPMHRSDGTSLPTSLEKVDENFVFCPRHAPANFP